jgi:non-canonical purine NTP pyrophosphatase (RdgB/HAM1 family)
MRRIILATRNPHKVEEVQAALSHLHHWSIEPQPDSIPEVDETGTTFVENAILKAAHASGFVEDLVLADDSGLCVDALDGRPGVFSARYAPSDPERIQRLLAELNAVPGERRTAAFVCALALAHRGDVIWTGEGRVDGSITRVANGTNGFGYDPIFWIPEFNRTLAELTREEKNRTSHRGRALRELEQHFAGSLRL